MVYRGTVKNGAVILDEPLGLADGTLVEVTTADGADETLEELFAPFIGKAMGLPADLSENLDHYITMQQYGIKGALTFDQHFVQAGFRALMR